MTCRGCGAEVAMLVEVARNGTPVVDLHLCEACMALALAEADNLRKEFEALVAGGLTRAEANVVMCAKVDAIIRAQLPRQEACPQ